MAGSFRLRKSTALSDISRHAAVYGEKLLTPAPKPTLWHITMNVYSIYLQLLSISRGNLQQQRTDITDGWKFLIYRKIRFHRNSINSVWYAAGARTDTTSPLCVRLCNSYKGKKVKCLIPRVIFKAIAAVNIKTAVWKFTPCSLVDIYRFFWRKRLPPSLDGLRLYWFQDVAEAYNDPSTNWPMVQMPLLVQGICTMRKTDTLLLPYNHTHTQTHTRRFARKWNSVLKEGGGKGGGCKKW